MATKKQKRERNLAKRAAFEEEQRQNGLKYLRQAQAQRAAEKAKAEAARKERAIAKSQKLAEEHRARKAAESSKPGTHNTVVAKKNHGGRPGRKRKVQKARARGRIQEA